MAPCTTWCSARGRTLCATLCTTRAYIASIGVKAGDVTRKRKQRDFALFGRTFDISLRPRVTPELIAACAAYPQYPVAEADVREAVAVAGHIVDENHEGLIRSIPAYDLLTPEFFSAASAEANATIVAKLCGKAS